MKINILTDTIDWVECGLPFYVPLRNDKNPMPNMEKIFRKEFPKEFNGMNIDYINENCRKVVEKYINSIDKAIDRFNETTEEKIDYIDPIHMKTFFVFLKKDGLKEIDINKIINYRKFRKLYGDWFENHPLILEWKTKMNEMIEENNKKSFSGLNLNKPGVLIEVKNNGVIKQYLIGHINSVVGVCNDCTEFDNDCIIIRYAILIEFPQIVE